LIKRMTQESWKIGGCDLSIKFEVHIRPEIGVYISGPLGIYLFTLADSGLALGVFGSPMFTLSAWMFTASVWCGLRETDLGGNNLEA